MRYLILTIVVALVATAESNEPAVLWTGPEIPKDVAKIPFVAGVQHQTIQRATKDDYKFLHGAAIIQHKGTLYANWANSPTNENGPHETLQGRRSSDLGKTWSDIEMIGRGFVGLERHSHGVFCMKGDELWTICSRFGDGPKAKRFPGLRAEAFVLDSDSDQWKSRGIVMENCWPYDQPVRTADGNYVTGGQDKDGLPVVAVSHGDDFLKWDTIPISYDPKLKPGFAETTVWADGNDVMAIIRGGGGFAWMANSSDGGRTWTRAVQSNYPMPRAKAFLSRLSTGELFMIANLHNRDTLVIAVGNPKEKTLNRIWRIRSGKSVPPRFHGFAKGKQWSYPYAHEFDGKLYVVYSIGKEDCGLSVFPIDGVQQTK